MTKEISYLHKQKTNCIFFIKGWPEKFEFIYNISPIDTRLCMTKWYPSLLFFGYKIQYITYIRNVIEETHLPSTRHDPIGGIPGDLKETKKEKFCAGYIFYVLYLLSKRSENFFSGKIKWKSRLSRELIHINKQRDIFIITKGVVENLKKIYFHANIFLSKDFLQLIVNQLHYNQRLAQDGFFCAICVS